MKHTFENYPEYSDPNCDYPPFYVEFSQWGGEKEQWRLFERNFIYSAEEWKKTEHSPFECREGHPYQLSNGIINPNEGVICMETKEFLKFMVDAMNEKWLADNIQNIMPNMRPLTREEQESISDYFWQLVETKENENNTKNTTSD